ncbi:MAG: hypothetical protein KHW38_06260, partial [Dorea sp.]|nr:hypothetical protein [Dorea sp.]
KTEKVAIIPFCKSNCHFHSSLFQSGNKLFTSLKSAVKSINECEKIVKIDKKHNKKSCTCYK